MLHNNQDRPSVPAPQDWRKMLKTLLSLTRAARAAQEREQEPSQPQREKIAA
jgi:hypothetical protein